MNRNRRVPIVNNAPRPANFERQAAGNPNRGTLTLKSGETYYERGINLTYETLVLKNSSGDCTSLSISLDDLADDRFEKIEVTFDTAHDFQLVWHQRRTWTEKVKDMFKNPFKSRPRGDTLPT